jgi:hypothetical protein
MVENLTDRQYTVTSPAFGIQLEIEEGENGAHRVILGSGFGVVGEGAARTDDAMYAGYLETHLRAAVLLRSVKETGAEVVGLQPGEEVIIRNLTTLSNDFKIA